MQTRIPRLRLAQSGSETKGQKSKSVSFRCHFDVIGCHSDANGTSVFGHSHSSAIRVSF